MGGLSRLEEGSAFFIHNDDTGNVHAYQNISGYECMDAKKNGDTWEQRHVGACILLKE